MVMDSKNLLGKESYKLVRLDRKNQDNKHKVLLGVLCEKIPLDIASDLGCIH
jgi:hypothetical protein